MADTVVDSLTIMLKLDPRQYNDAQKKAIESLRTTKETAASTAKELESRGAQGAEFFNQMTSSALKLGAVLVGGIGLKDMISNATQAGNAAQYFSKNIGINVGELSLWQNAVRQIGGDINQVGPAFLGLSQALQTIALRGPGSSELIATFQALGVTLTDPLTGRLKTVAELLPQLHDAFQKVSPGVAYNLGSAIGLTPDLINLLEKIDPEFQKYLANAKAAGTITAEQAKAANDLTGAWGNLWNFLDRVGREMTTEISPVLTTVTNGIVSLGEALDKVGDNYAASDLGAFIGGVAGFLVGGPLGAAAGVVAGGLTGAAFSGKGKASPNGGSSDLFGLIQKLEGSGYDSVSSAGAIGRNQILPGTAAQYGFDPSRLHEPAYNDMAARAIEGDLSRRYKGDTDAIAIAYHSGPRAADRFLAAGRNPSVLGPKGQQYLALERAITGGTSTTTINTINVNAPNATDAKGIGNGIRAALASNALISQGNVGTR